MCMGWTPDDSQRVPQENKPAVGLHMRNMQNGYLNRDNFNPPKHFSIYYIFLHFSYNSFDYFFKNLLLKFSIFVNCAQKEVHC